jgi:hypothetical protein
LADRQKVVVHSNALPELTDQTLGMRVDRITGKVEKYHIGITELRRWGRNLRLS